MSNYHHYSIALNEKDQKDYELVSAHFKCGPTAIFKTMVKALKSQMPELSARIVADTLTQEE